MKILIIVFFCIIGGSMGKKMKIPAGAMLGSIFVMVAHNYFFKEIILPNNFKMLVQILTGAYIGSKIGIDDIKGFRYILKPAITILFVMVILNFVMVFFMMKFTDMDFVTAVFATSPGGLPDMAIIAYDFGADVSKITILQLVRLLSVIIIPNIIEILLKRFNNISIKEKEINVKKVQNKNEISKIIITFLISSLGGIVGYKLGIPAGTMTFAMIFTAIYNITLKKAYIPMKVKDLAQILAGVLIGSKVTVSDILQLNTIGIPVFIVILGFILMNIILGTLVYKTSDFNLSTSFFSASPGGMTNISIIADDFGADTPKVSVIQLMRVISIIAFYPIIIIFVMKILNLN
ncbi:AbrB family transcriptional regulator [Fusobacterium sp. IOR10]|uniref:AbrB family transcriptional regulator n=1 Tax=Fusobacterium sp. IOR10 TaxID=2665157 RepID=UPI0013D7650B|nr:AbrB family transcriptional regulator [Fusobacterium sp. IOR10]